MANFKDYEIGQSLNLHIDFDEFLPAHHFARKIEQLVSELDIEDILESYSPTGQKAYDPRMLLSIIFYGYMQGIRSGRKLAAACRTNLVFIYLSKCYRLGKSTINDFRKNHYVHFESLFLQVLQKCQDAGIVDPSVSIIDGSKIDANSSKKYSRTKGQFEKWQECLSRDIAELEKEAIDSPTADVPARLAKKKLQKEKVDTLLSSFEGDDEGEKKNLTDVDAPIMRTKKGGYDTAYNVQVGCTENQIITYANVVTQGNDKAQLIPAAEGIKNNTGLPVEKVLADADYGSYDSLEYMAQENIKGYVPYRDMNIDVTDRPYHAALFEYAADKDAYTCPQGETLIFKREVKSKGRVYRYYQTDACKTCPVKDLCISAKKAGRRVISREVREPLREEMKERLKSEEGKKMYLRRMHPVEAIFGHLKHNLGYTQFLLRGIEKVNAEFTLMCLAQNLRKLMMSLGGFLKNLLLWDLIRRQNGKTPDLSINFLKCENIITHKLYSHVFSF